MQIIARCPRCSRAWRLDAGAADRRLRCKKCGRLFKVPKPEQVPKALKVINQAKGSVHVDETGDTFG